MKNYSWISPFFIMILLICLSLGPASAGPLDRTSEPRTNPVVDDMLRIPGVVGLSKQEAMSTLQQAGLSPIIKTKRTLNNKHKGMEGKVIFQIPYPGGVAMIGSSVTINIYMPPGYSEGQAGDDQWQGEPYDGYKGQPGGYDQQNHPGEEEQWPEDDPGKNEQWPEDDSGKNEQWQNEGQPDDQLNKYYDKSNKQSDRQPPEQKNSKFKQVKPGKPKIIWKPTK